MVTSNAIDANYVDIGSISFGINFHLLFSGADPGFLDVGFDLLILPDFLLIFPDFLKILHENEINFVSSGGGGSSEPLEPLMDPPLILYFKESKVEISKL